LANSSKSNLDIVNVPPFSFRIQSGSSLIEMRIFVSALRVFDGLSCQRGIGASQYPKLFGVVFSLRIRWFLGFALRPFLNFRLPICVDKSYKRQGF